MKIADQTDVLCFIKHGDKKCARCNRGLMIWSKLRRERRKNK